MDDPPRYGRALLALTAAATLVAAAFGDMALPPAGGPDPGYTPVAYVFTLAGHDVGHNDWAFQGAPNGRVTWLAGWIATYVALWLFWLGVALWMRISGGRRAPWLRVWAAAWLTQLAVFGLSFGTTYWAEHSSSLTPTLLRIADVCSPWWTCVAALAAVALAERGRLLIRATAGYALLLAVLLLVPVPGPAWLWITVLAAVAAVPAALTPAEPLPAGPPAAAQLSGLTAGPSRGT